MTLKTGGEKRPSLHASAEKRGKTASALQRQGGVSPISSHAPLPEGLRLSSAARGAPPPRADSRAKQRPRLPIRQLRS